MQAKNVLYAAVGAPVVAARKVSGTVGALRSKINEEAGDYTKIATKTVDDWAKEGEKLVSRVADNEKVEELASRVDLDQAKSRSASCVRSSRTCSTHGARRSVRRRQ